MAHPRRAPEPGILGLILSIAHSYLESTHRHCLPQTQKPRRALKEARDEVSLSWGVGRTPEARASLPVCRGRALEDLPPGAEQKPGGRRGETLGSELSSELQLMLLVYKLKNHNELWNDSRLPKCQRNVVARQVDEASAKMGSRNQAWAVATPGSSWEAKATGAAATLLTTGAPGDSPQTSTEPP